ncbi:hypothetical protein KKB43_00455 [Patescibacteria group bacterium]|nr:hypothetical protein [Patescibacteria group bacterium]MBU4141930.1 hypothetical protein [Patescibacteria group bacterium]MBU4339126.1 hypothetical protein [Patescibacteria group bacterium]MBU4579470.1 hypothetical protein [Patescibacteria group bacterium]
MLDKEVIKDFLESFLEDIEIPKDVNMDDLANIFIDYCESDYYEWLKDNAKSFFYSSDGIRWDYVIQKIRDKKK